MRTIGLPKMLFLFVSTSINAQTLNLDTNSLATPGKDTSYFVVDRQPHARVWQQIVSQTNALGQTIRATNSFTELATGLFHQQNGRWVESNDQIDMLLDGSGAVASNGQHQVFFPANIYDGAIGVTTPDGLKLQSRPLGLSYFDGTNSVLIAELKSSIGQLSAGGNQITWTDAFTDIRADLVSTYKKSGFECDLVIRQWPGSISPTAFGMDPNSTRLQLLTEFFDTPDPELQPLAVGGTNTPAVGISSVADPYRSQGSLLALRFGSMLMPAGRAFSIGTGSATGKTFRVMKSWNKLDGRTFLIEELPYSYIEPELEGLQASTRDPGVTNLIAHSIRKGTFGRSLPSIRTVRRSTDHMQLGNADPPQGHGFVLDYELNGSSTNFVFRSDTTYFVSGSFYVSGWAVLEGNTVIKYTNSPTAKISVSGPLLCRTESYKPAILTAQNNNTVGVTVAGSTGTPTITSATFIEDTSDADNSYSHIRFSYAGRGVSITAGFTQNGFWHCQFVNCGTNIQSVASSVNLYNVLAANCGTCVSGAGYFSASHLTCDQCTTLGSGLSAPSSSSLVNSILTGVTNVDSSYSFVSCAQAASRNGFYTNVAAGNYYLIPGSTNHNAGTTNLSVINGALLSDLQYLTTYPPLVLSNASVLTNTTLAPQAQRNIGLPDLGYHYDPIDYLTYGYAVSNATLTITNGTAIGYYDYNGILLQPGGQINSVGLATAYNWFVDYRAAQEQQIQIGSFAVGTGWPINANRSGSGSPGTFSFTVFSRPTTLWYAYDLYVGDGWAISPLTISDCKFNGRVCYFAGVDNGTLTLRNNVFERESFTLTYYDYDSYNVSFYNNLFRYGSLSIDNEGAGPWTVRDNIFDSCSLDEESGIPHNADHNAYINVVGTLYGDGTNDVTLTNFAYANGIFGRYYQASTNLIDAGSRTADAAGLFHYTARNDNTKEASSIVDIGFHSVAAGPATPATVWVDDAYPSDSALWADNDNWYWTNSPSPFSGSLCHKSSTYSGMHQHVFYNTANTITIGPGDTLFCYVFLYDTNLPSEVMVQWQATDGSWWYHRAFWGNDNILGWGTRTYVGPIPTQGGWVRLEVPARDVDLEGRTINGMAFTLYGATAAWDYTGRMPPRFPIDTTGHGMPDYLCDPNGNGLCDFGELPFAITIDNPMNGAVLY